MTLLKYYGPGKNRWNIVASTVHHHPSEAWFPDDIWAYI
jgi:hypothetical protein